MLHKNAKKVISGVLGTCLVFQLAALPSLAQTSNVPDQTQTAVTAQENSGVQTLASTSFTDVLLSVGANNTQMNATWYAAQEGAGSVLDPDLEANIQIMYEFIFGDESEEEETTAAE